MLGKNSFEASIMMKVWGSRLSIFGKFQLQVQFPFLEISDLASNSSMMVFDMIYEDYLAMNELSQTNSNHQITD